MFEKQSHRLGAMDQISFPFMRLPTELQAGIVNHLREGPEILYIGQGNSDLKSLCLVSKHVSDIATRCLYYNVIITNSRYIKIKEKIKSLLIKPANLQFVRVMNTDKMSFEESILMDRILPHLSKDSLKEINFTSSRLGEFPMPHQVEFLWHNQKTLRNLTLVTYMVPWLDKFSKELQPAGRSAILKLFTDLELNGDFEKVHQCTQTNMLWPLQNLDLTVLQKLTFSSKFINSSIFSTLNTLFTGGSFVNLSHLCFKYICNLSQTLTLTRMPSLEWLSVDDCDFQGPDLPLVLADDIRLKSFDCKTSFNVEKLIPLLTQAKGLEWLFWDCGPGSLEPDGIDGNLIRAITAHRDTLLELWLFGEFVCLDLRLEAMLWKKVRRLLRTE